MDYRVTWEIDVEADGPDQAAWAALECQSADTTANVFYIRPAQTSFGEPRGVKVDFGDMPRSALPGAVAEAEASVTLDDVRALLGDLDRGKVEDLEEVARWCRTLLENAENRSADGA